MTQGPHESSPTGGWSWWLSSGRWIVPLGALLAFGSCVAMPAVVYLLSWWSYRPLVQAVCRDYPQLDQDRALFERHRYPIELINQKIARLDHADVDDIDPLIVGWTERYPLPEKPGYVYIFRGPDGDYDLVLARNSRGQLAVWPQLDGFGTLVDCD